MLQGWDETEGVIAESLPKVLFSRLVFITLCFR